MQKLQAMLTASERKGAILLLGLMLVGMAMEILGIGMILPVVALMIRGDLPLHFHFIRPVLNFFGNPDQAWLITGAMLALVGIYLVKNLFLAFLAWQQARFAADVQINLSQRLFSVYLHQPYTFHLQRNSAQLVRNIATDVVQLSMAVTSYLALVSEALVLSGLVLMLVVVEPLGALIAVMILGSAAWVFYRGTHARLASWGKARQYHDGMRIQHLQQGLGGAKDMKLLGREHNFLEQFREHNMKSARARQFQATLQQFPRLWLETLAVIGLAILVMSMLWQGRDMSGIVPKLALFVAAAFRVMPSVNRVLSAMQSMRFSGTVIESLYEELALEAQVCGALAADGKQGSLQKEIRLVTVTYKYPAASSLALDGMDIVIYKGESVGIIGSSGSGKSTLVDVLLGLLTPYSGQVTVDGLDIRENLRAWQNQIGYVPQSIYLTDDTLRRNVAFGISDADIDGAAVQKAIASAQLEKFVSSLPAGLETIVGERGVRLSGGQRQRIGIARALYHDPTVLVLDEATSALDTATESGVMEAVTALHGDKTIVIVAHRLSTVEGCDRLFRLEHGRLVGEGTPAEMLAHSKATITLP
jgi:ABC-type multidrug transport system fused ATPase/permease subunit